MIKAIIYCGICIVFYVIYFVILRFIWDMFIPFNIVTDLISVFILIFVNVPLALISANKIVAIIRKE
ncbi:hypothetical protein [Clostridium sp.]|uniref:hypothetical protein n=1 Tax=Clostridium sp. TaxID=1506 RepID=UPI0039F644C4